MSLYKLLILKVEVEVVVGGVVVAVVGESKFRYFGSKWCGRVRTALLGWGLTSISYGIRSSS